MTDVHIPAESREVMETAAVDRIRALFEEQEAQGKVTIPVWMYGTEEDDRRFVCALRRNASDQAAAEQEIRELLHGIFDCAGTDPETAVMPDPFAETWLAPLLDEQGVEECGDYGFFRPGGEYCVCGETTPEEKTAAEHRVGVSEFAPDVIAHARRLCRLLELNAPAILLKCSAAALAEALILHRCAASCIANPASAEPTADNA